LVLTLINFIVGTRLNYVVDKYFNVTGAIIEIEGNAVFTGVGSNGNPLINKGSQ